MVPPLQGFVMNRVQGDYFETLLYKIFVSIDEHTNIAELANVLQIDSELVKVGGATSCWSPNTSKTLRVRTKCMGLYSV